MQAPSKSRASAVAVPESAPTIVRMLVALMATVTLLFIFRPTVVHAQEPAKPAPVKPAEAKHPEVKHADPHAAAAKPADAHAPAAKAADAHAPAAQPADAHAPAAKAADAHAPAAKPADAHAPAAKPADAHAPAAKAVEAHAPAAKPADAHAPAAKAADAHAPAAKPADAHAPAAKAVEAHAPAAKPADAHAPAPKAADAHAPAAKPVDAHAPAAKPAESHAPAAKPVDAHAPAAKPTEAHSAPVQPPVARPTPTPAAAHAPTTTTGSAQGALAEQTAGKSDAAPKEPVKAAPRAVRPAAAKVATTTAPAPAKAKVETAHAVDAHAAVEAHAVDAHATDAHAAEAVSHEAASDAFASANREAVTIAPPRIWGPVGSSLSYARGNEEPTVFISKALDEKQADVEVEALLPVIAPRARSAEYASAPFAISAATLTSSGIVGHQNAPVRGLRARATAAVTKTEVMPRRLQLLDEIEVTLPAGATPKVGNRYVTVDGDRLYKSATLIAVPTGVLEVVSVEEGNVVTARVVQLAGAVQEGQRVLAIEGNAITTGAEVVAVPRSTKAPESEVIWVNGDGSVASLQSQLVLGAGEQQGVKVGDQFALVKRSSTAPDAAEQRIAVVRVVRVTAYGSSAIVVRQDQPGLAVGVAARLIGRVQ